MPRVDETDKTYLSLCTAYSDNEHPIDDGLTAARFWSFEENKQYYKPTTFLTCSDVMGWIPRKDMKARIMEDAAEVMKAFQTDKDYWFVDLDTVQMHVHLCYNPDPLFFETYVSDYKFPTSYAVSRTGELTLVKGEDVLSHLSDIWLSSEVRLPDREQRWRRWKRREDRRFESSAAYKEDRRRFDEKLKRDFDKNDAATSSSLAVPIPDWRSN